MRLPAVRRNAAVELILRSLPTHLLRDERVSFIEQKNYVFVLFQGKTVSLVINSTSLNTIFLPAQVSLDSLLIIVY